MKKNILTLLSNTLLFCLYHSPVQSMEQPSHLIELLETKKFNSNNSDHNKLLHNELMACITRRDKKTICDILLAASMHSEEIILSEETVKQAYQAEIKMRAHDISVFNSLDNAIQKAGIDLTHFSSDSDNNKKILQDMLSHAIEKNRDIINPIVFYNGNEVIYDNPKAVKKITKQYNAMQMTEPFFIQIYPDIPHSQSLLGCSPTEDEGQ